MLVFQRPWSVDEDVSVLGDVPQLGQGGRIVVPLFEIERQVISRTLGPLQHRGLWVGGYAENGSVLRGAAHGVGDDGGEVDRDGGFPHAALLIGNDMHVCHVLPPYASWPEIGRASSRERVGV